MPMYVPGCILVSIMGLNRTADITGLKYPPLELFFSCQTSPGRLSHLGLLTYHIIIKAMRLSRGEHAYSVTH